ncbi:DUF1576 domain-containing protein [Crocosphaera sp. Alani8]|uniref:DUF1576 domain-containing protein n=1 Tax=Crocosphaera sp. Alani8 TaxID=3038952 RepID=UPI00313D5F0F
MGSVNDYIGIGGMGASFVNAGLLTLIACALYRITKAKISGTAVACLFLLMGFGLFGKNLINVWSIVAGVYLYARFRQEVFANYINVAFFGGALAPIFSEILYSSTLSLPFRVPLAVGTSLMLGFILPPVAAHLPKTHLGFNLYNIGFTAGVMGNLIVALYKSYGFVPDPVMIWTSGNNTILGTFLIILITSMILVGFWLDRHSWAKLPTILSSSGQAPTDFIALVGFGPTLVNMGLCGLIGLIYILLVKADLNGPTMAGLFTIIGFAAFGKHPKNIIPIMMGIFLGTLTRSVNANEAPSILAALFGTSLAPIAGKFGWFLGVLAGLIHSSAVLSVGIPKAGLNLYNNGFVAGIVATVMVPVIISLTSPTNK